MKLTTTTTTTKEKIELQTFSSQPKKKKRKKKKEKKKKKKTMMMKILRHACRRWLPTESYFERASVHLLDHSYALGRAGMS